VKPSSLESNDRSTGPSPGPRDAAGLGRQARRFVAASVALLLAACSQLQLGYNNADRALAYSLDSYLDLDDRQEELARVRIAALHCWHRRTQLPGYAQLLADAQAKVAGPVTAAEVSDFASGVRRALAAVGEQAAPDLAALALTLKPAQIDRLAERLARDTSEARRELVRYAGSDPLEQRVERYVEQAEGWFGTLSPAQRAMIRASLQRRPEAQEAWMAERERRHRELVAVMTRIRTEQPSPARATDWLREYFAELAEPRDPARRARLATYRQDSAELLAQLVSSATPAQRTVLAKRLRGYAADLEVLAAKTTAGGGCG